MPRGNQHLDVRVRVKKSGVWNGKSNADREKAGGLGPPASRGSNVSLQLAISITGGEGAHGTEPDGDDALVLGGVEAGRTQALRLAERHRLPIKRGFDAGIEHLNRQPPPRHGVPIRV